MAVVVQSRRGGISAAGAAMTSTPHDDGPRFRKRPASDKRPAGVIAALPLPIIRQIRKTLSSDPGGRLTEHDRRRIDRASI
jgi:hypothetical protein